MLGQVLGITAIGMAVSALAVYFFRDQVGGMAGIIAMLVGFGLLIAINATRANPALSLLLFYAFAFAEGIGITPIVSLYLHVAPDAVFNAATRRPRRAWARSAASFTRPVWICAASRES